MSEEVTPGSGQPAADPTIATLNGTPPGDAPANPAAPPAEPPKPQDDFLKKFELLTRKERDILERETKFKSDNQKWQEKETKLKQYESDIELAQYDPISFLQKYGWSPERLNEHLKTSSADPHTMKLQRELEEIKKQLQQNQDKEKDGEKRRIKEQHLNEIKNFISANAEKYELVKEYNMHEEVFNLQNEYFNKYQETLSFDIAAEQVEQYLDKQLEKVLSYKKVKSKLGVQEKTEGADQLSESSPAANSNPQQSGPNTLSNTNFASNSPANSNRPLSRQESLDRAAKLLKFID